MGRDCEEVRSSRAMAVARPALVPGGETRSESVSWKPVSPSPVGVSEVPEAGGSVSGKQPTDDDVEMGAAITKWMREEDDDDFITQNKPAKLGSSPLNLTDSHLTKLTRII